MLAVHESPASAGRDSLVMSHAAATAAACIVPCLSVKVKICQNDARQGVTSMSGTAEK